MALARMALPLILFGVAQLLKRASQWHPHFNRRVQEHNFVAQIMMRDEAIGRWFRFKDGITYSVQIFSGGRSKILQINLGTSVNLGEIRL